MKIYTITCHDVYNYGASLQAHALMIYLQQLGHCVEIIDYKPEYLSKRGDLFAVNPKYSTNVLKKLFFLSVKVPMRLLFEWSRVRSFNHFTRNFLTLTPQTYHSCAELEASLPCADIYIAGSDQIWNSFYNNGKDPSFYLQFAPKNTIKASYAASFSISVLEESIKPIAKTWLKSLDYIAVRETTGLAILEDLNIHKGIQVVDPVLLLGREYWSQIASKKLIKGNYLLVYDFEKNSEIQLLAKRIAREKNLNIVSITDFYKLDYADVSINYAGPQEFLSLIKNCDFFISNSFHGTVFSMIFRKDFYTFNRLVHKVNSRMSDLLASVGLSDRIITPTSSDFQITPVDYSQYKNILYNIEKSKQYINSIINNSFSTY